jgi:hypothetical protein
MLCNRWALPAAPEIALEGAPEPAPPAPPPADGRVVADPSAPSRNEVRVQLLNQRLAGFADRDLAKLRAEAIIRAP